MKRQRAFYVPYTSRPYQGARRPRAKAVARGPSPTKAEVRKMIMSRIETKHFQTSAMISPPEVNGESQYISGIAQSDLSNGREGQQVRAVSLDMNWSWTITDATNLVRFLVVKVNEYITPSNANFWNSPESALYSPLNEALPKRFTVLFDSGILALSANTPQLAGKLHIPLKHRINYSNALNTNAHGGLYILTASDSTVVTHPAFVHVSTLKFKDE